MVDLNEKDVIFTIVWSGIAEANTMDFYFPLRYSIYIFFSI